MLEIKKGFVGPTTVVNDPEFSPVSGLLPSAFMAPQSWMITGGGRSSLLR